MTDEPVDLAAKTLFKLLSGGSPTSDEFARSYDEMRPDEACDAFWSNHSNSTIFEYLQDLCQHFGIDAAKMTQFVEAIRDCDYCGEHIAKVRKMPDGECVCEDCLEHE